jgi:hypothetical protein
MKTTRVVLFTDDVKTEIMEIVMASLKKMFGAKASLPYISVFRDVLKETQQPPLRVVYDDKGLTVTVETDSLLKFDKIDPQSLCEKSVAMITKKSISKYKYQFFVAMPKKVAKAPRKKVLVKPQ